MANTQLITEVTASDRIASFLRGFTIEDRSTILDAPDLMGFAFVSDGNLCYFNHVRLEADGNVSGTLGVGNEVVSISKDALFLDCFRWIDSKSVALFKQTMHVGDPMDIDTLAIVALGENATDADLLAFSRAGRTPIYPPEYGNDHACIIGIPRILPIFRNDPLLQNKPENRQPLAGDLRDLWLFVQFHSLPVSEEFTALPGFSWMALWEFPGMVCPGTIQFQLKFVHYTEEDIVWSNVRRRVLQLGHPALTRPKMKRPLVVKLGDPASKRITCLTAISTQAPTPLPDISVNTNVSLGIPPSVGLKDVYTHLSLFYCVLEVDQNHVTSVSHPTFNPHFQQGLEKCTDKKSLFKYVQRNFLASKKEFLTSKHHLCNYVDFTSFQPTLPLFNLFAEASIMTKPFQSFVDAKELSSVVSLGSFALPKKTMSSYRDYIAVTESNVLDFIAEQSKEKAEALQTKLFPFTFFDRSFDDVMIAVANFLAFSQSIVHMTWSEDDPNNPTIIRMMLELVQLAKHKDLRNLFSKALTDKITRMPWVYHSLFLSFQNLFQHAASLLMSPVATMAVQCSSMAQIPLDEFDPWITCFSYTCKELTSMSRVLAVCADSYKACPESFYSIGSGFVYTRDRSTGDGDRTKTQHTDKEKDKDGDTRGWLKLLDSSKRPFDFRPPALSETVCLHHAFEGFRCKFSSCIYKHCNALSDLSSSDQAIVKSYIDANSTLFALHTANNRKRGGVSTKKTVLLSE